jgi:hypothetical protein
MEALAGLSIAANVMQVIAFCRDTIVLCKSLRDTGSVNPDLAEKTVKVRSLVEDLESRLNQSAMFFNEVQNATIKKQLPELCKEVVSAAKELEGRLRLPTGPKPGRFSKLGAAKTALKTRMGRSEIEKSDRRLLRLEQTLQTQLISGIWYDNTSATDQSIDC